ncbi:hypothetical protein FNV43_RR26655 [Rhamnella rubrinervis]|uniref:non-specific serine/threonine protein kinase n=1 Tax=Rhamnella rubrinervis TaxID=2594499 RepID=A0A8K0GMQ2_9ROSA|nr:hypothetical protein FNV43_RR26655 [Rhamnella rubrinervis]
MRLQKLINLEKLIQVGIIIFFFLTLSVESVLSTDPRYEACRGPRNCGTGPSISYPFYIHGAGVDFCGQPDFKIVCEEKKPIYSTPRGPYIIKDISYENQSFRLAAVELENTTFLLWMQRIIYTELERFLVPCASNSSYHSFVALVPGTVDLSKGKGCESEVAVPINLEGDQTNQTITSVDYVELLKTGFILEWHGDACEKYCRESGGRCGYENGVSVCFCPHGTHPTNCNENVLLNSAEEEKHHPHCEPFQCGKLGEIRWPYKEKKHPHHCGLYTVDCSEENSPKIQLKKEGHWYQISKISQADSIFINDTDLRKTLTSRSCESLEKFGLPSPSLFFSPFKPNIVNLFKCNSSLHITLPTAFYSTNCGDYNLFYTLIPNSSLDYNLFPPQCSFIQLPANNTGNVHSDLFEFQLASSFYLHVEVIQSLECLKCQERGGECLLADSKKQFRCTKGLERKPSTNSHCLTGVLSREMEIYMLSLGEKNKEEPEKKCKIGSFPLSTSSVCSVFYSSHKDHGPKLAWFRILKMHAVAVFVVFVLTHLVLLYTAEEDPQHEFCPKFDCGNLSSIGTPFYNFRQQIHCDGGYPVDCREPNNPKIQLIKEGHWRQRMEEEIEVWTRFRIGSSGFVLIIFMLWRYKERHASKFLARSITDPQLNRDLEEASVYCGVPVFSYTDLQKATNNFDSEKELGDGGFGTVYHGKLKDGREVAVKRLYQHNYKRVEQFKNEVEILTRLRHKNLVSLYGCTSRHSRELLLVYEYIPKGTVADHLHGDRAQPGSLPWSIRMSIAIETATALTYLHASDIVHRDVKTNNILLDNNFSVKVADFGLSRLFPTDVTHISTCPQGTPGYVDPEYHQCYQLTTKSDVYSFGVVLIELISSMPAVDITRQKEEINLANLATNKIQKCEFNELIDPSIGFESDGEVRRMTIAVAALAFQCLQQSKEMRPSMEEVLEALKSIEREVDRPEDQEKEFDDLGVTERVQPPSSPECDELGLLKNTRPPLSPISVTQNGPVRDL